MTYTFTHFLPDLEDLHIQNIKQLSILEPYLTNQSYYHIAICQYHQCVSLIPEYCAYIIVLFIYYSNKYLMTNILLNHQGKPQEMLG